VSFFATHAEDANPKQYLPQPSSMALYRDVTIPIPSTANEESFRRLPPFLQQPTNEGRIRWKWRFDEPDKYQEMMKNYYRLCTEVDTTCGRVIDTLKDEGILDRTLILFMGDNGYFHGEHGLADKWYPYEESIRVPLIVQDPRIPERLRGGTNADFVLNVDVAPTILAAANLSAPATMQGRDFAPLYLSDSIPEPPWRQCFFYEHAIISNKERIPASQALVCHDAKYILWPDYGVEELFDLKADPKEQNNLLGDPAYAEKLDHMRRRFATLRMETK
jgi:arylsulfatase A-like enzyme